MKHLGMNLRQGIRSLLKAPGYSAAAVLSFSLGIGACTIVFAIVHAVLLQPLPYANPDEIVALFLKEPQNDHPRNPTSPLEFRQWKESHSIDHMTAATPWSPVLTGSGNPDVLRGLKASASLFQLLGVQPALGRTFVDEEGEPGKNQVVVLGYRLWQRRFGGDAAIVNRRILLDGQFHTVIGVMPKPFEFPPFWVTNAEIWTPLAVTTEEWERRSRFLRVFGRLERGVEIQEARSEMDLIAGRIAKENPIDNAGTGILVEPLREPVVSGVRPALYLLSGAVLFLFLVACANVANLQLMRGVGKSREYAVRIALGARRAHIAMESLTESLLLSAAGGLLGLISAFWAVPAFGTLAAGSLPPVAELHIDTNVFVFAFLASVFSAVCSGILPVWQASRRNPGPALAESGRQTGSSGSGRLRNLIAVTEIAVAVVLMAGAGLLLRSYFTLANLDPGFQRDRLVTAVVSLAGSPFETADRQHQFVEEIRLALKAAPGVEDAGVANFLPIGGDLWGMRFAVDGRPIPPPNQLPRASFRIVSPGYIRAMGTVMVQGRDFNEYDTADSQPVVVVNRALASKYWPGENPVGKRIRWGAEPKEPALTIVGVAGDVRTWDLADDIRYEVYFPFAQSPMKTNRQISLVVRSAVAPARMIGAIQSAVWAIDRNIPVTDVQSMQEVLSSSMSNRFFHSLLLTCFAALGLTLGAAGIYGVMSYDVSQKTKEIGIRMALGATSRKILVMVTARGLRMAVIGLTVGILGALGLARLVQSLLFGVAPSDPFTFAAVALTLTVAATVACGAPAWRASHSDPAMILRCE